MGHYGDASVKISKIRKTLYRTASELGDVQAVASGNPEKIVERAENKLIWRGFGKLFRTFRGR